LDFAAAAHCCFRHPEEATMRNGKNWWLCLLLLGGAVRADLLDNAIGVQGVLSVNGAPAEGVHDLRVTPYPDRFAGVPLAPALEIDNVFVSQGAFSTKVDFGSTLFLGDKVFFEIAIRAGNSTGAYEVLAPRQEVTAAPYALKPAAGSVTDLEIATGAVGPVQIADGAVDTSELGDGAVTTSKLGDAQVTGAKLAANAVTLANVAANAVDGSRIVDGSIGAADLAPGLLSLPSWNLAGNATSAGQFLGTTNGTPLELRSDVGVTLNGARFNNSTELVIRGSPTAAETNADLTLWPRGGTAFFNIAALGNDPATAKLEIHAIGTSPFTGFDPRLTLTHAGALGIGGNDPTPAASLHVTRNDVGVDANDLAEAYEFIAEDGDAQAALLSSNAGGGGSTLLLGEMNASAYVNGWGLWRATGGIANVPLHFSYGTSSAAPGNPSRMTLYSDGSLFAGNVAPTNTPVSSFVFADGSSASAFNSTGANQFLVRAAGGAAFNRAPSSSVELTVGPNNAGDETDLRLGPDGSTASAVNILMGTPATQSYFWLRSSGAPPGDTATFTIFNRNGATNNSPIFQLYSDASPFVRRLALFRGQQDGSFFLPNFPIHVGESSIPNSGNGAHLTTGGVWTNGSSRLFKRDFAPIDHDAILARVLALPVLQWRYQGEDEGLHLGPIAEDFKAAFGLGGDERYIGTVDADGVALAAIQGLNARLERDNRDLRAALAALTARLEALERAKDGRDAH
jgi:hypothetical protein